MREVPALIPLFDFELSNSKDEAEAGWWHCSIFSKGSMLINCHDVEQHPSCSLIMYAGLVFCSKPVCCCP